VPCTHRLRDIIRGLRASANDRRHRPRPAHINCGVCTSTGDNNRDLRASARRRPPTAGGISQGLHASDIACANLANDVEQRHAASAKVCTLQSWCVRIGWASPAVASAHRPLTGDIGQGLDTSTVVCAHLANDVGQRHAASSKAFMHQPWHMRIVWMTSVVACAHRPTAGNIG